MTGQRDNQTSKWADRLWFVQYAKNRRFHSGKGKSPMTVGLEGLQLSKEITCDVTTEEQLMEVCVQSDLGGFDVEVREQAVDGPCLTCVSCQQAASGVHKCAICGQVSHTIQPCSIAMGDEEGYRAPVMCCHCQTVQNRREQQRAARRKQEDQAQKMKELSAKRIKGAEVGQCARVPVPELDRGKTDPCNVLAVMLEVTEDGCYRLGTKNGVLKQMYAQNQFDPCVESFLSIAEVLPAVALTSAIVREEVCSVIANAMEALLL
ncbi:hypothetical protein AAFF_G00349540 [Aldrovandia affinis]|uniref:Uncharacterized protein n=1 Tax=Aldrovandia affinis TaxID=143900 RepID=A0AAD7SJF4_9TELE|nr:hypothetical protein AAFF_G00349540 [Aldrovandia affinis]